MVWYLRAQMVKFRQDLRCRRPTKVQFRQDLCCRRPTKVEFREFFRCFRADMVHFRQLLYFRYRSLTCHWHISNLALVTAAGDSRPPYI